MASPIPSPSPFSRLPVELVKRIVDLVAEQDQRFEISGLRVAPYDEPDGEESKDVAGGTWPGGYGTGCRALSEVNKQLRELALPHVFTSVTVAMLESKAFRFSVLGRPPCRAISVLDLADSVGEARLHGVAWAIQHLPNLSGLTLSGHWPSEELNAALELPYDDEFTYEEREEYDDLSERRELERAAVEAVFSRVKELRLVDTTATSAEHILAGLSRLSTPPPLDSLRLEGTLPLLSESSLLGALQGYKGSRLAVLHNSPFSTGGPHPSFLADLRLPCLTHLTLTASGLGSEALSFAHAIAPNLERLNLIDIHDSPEYTFSGTFLRLHTVQLEGVRSLTRLLPLFTASPIHVFYLDFAPDVMRGSLKRTFPSSTPWPATLRFLRLRWPSNLRPHDAAAFSAEMAERGIDVALRWDPRTDFQRAAPAYASDKRSEKVRQEQRRVLIDDLKWARAQAVQLEKQGDTAGMQELTEVLQRLREKRTIAEQ
ncbi:hypothetical protein JCM10213_004239 [Rhodosporidiobolus nylandii]